MYLIVKMKNKTKIYYFKHRFINYYIHLIWYKIIAQEVGVVEEKKF